MPTVREALEILDLEIERARRQELPCFKIIHGYGSKGVGGKIKISVRNVLRDKKKLGKIKDYILGEEWSIFNQKTRELLAMVPDAKKDGDLERLNLGVTIIIL